MAWIIRLPLAPRHPRTRWQVRYRDGTTQRSAGIYPTCSASNARSSLRATGRTPKEIARALGLRPAQVAPLVRTIAAEEHAGAAEPKLAGCWVSPGWRQGLTVQGHPEWPDLEVADEEALGLVSVLVTRQVRYGRVRLCGWLVDVYCLGVKDVVGPRVMDQRRAADFRGSFFAAYQAMPIEAPLELAQQLVFGAVEYARGLGFEPARGFAATTDLLGPRAGPSAIRFGRDGKPFFVQGPHDDADAILRALRESLPAGLDGYQGLLRCLEQGQVVDDARSMLVDQAVGVWARPGFETLVSLPRLRFEPFGYQLQAAGTALRTMRGRAILADEVGWARPSRPGWSPASCACAAWRPGR